MKKRFFKITSFLLAFTVFFSTLSFSVNRHYCGDMLFSQSFFVHAEDCGMQQMNLCLDDNSNLQSSINNKCCHNVHLLIKGQIPQQKALQAASLEVQNLVLIVSFNNFYFEDAYQQQPALYQNYIPPLLVKNIPVLVQTFRI